ncbi:type IV pilin-like G/H family protein [Microcoleus sp. OTE_8_concoct_300]|uniref:type IV pilin-like G/H family protein n=1 Tax=Microcoleus sp. OTE_8_concoct_300 TaxID=2964710 RepID=UPI00403EF95D
MRQQKSKSNSILLKVYSILLKGCGCLLLVFIGFIGCHLFVSPLFFSFGIKDKQVEIFVDSFVRLANNLMQSEAIGYLRSMNKGQQAYFAETSAFSNSIPALGLGLETETNNYKYSTRATQTAAFNYAVSKKKTLNNYVGGVFLVPAKKLDPNARRDEMTTLTILCETEKRPFFRVKRTDEPDELAEPIYQNGEIICGKGTTQLTN